MSRSYPILITLLLWLLFLPGCEVPKPGGTEIAFLRGGDMWTLAPSGAGLFRITNNGHIRSFAWSPTHRLLVFRALDEPPPHPSVDLYTVSIDGGNTLQITGGGADLQHSEATWSFAGTRLVYREGKGPDFATHPARAWFLSQNDQPLDIARLRLPDSISWPSLRPDAQAVAGVSEHGDLFIAGVPKGSHPHVLTSLHPSTASLLARQQLRVLWQPGRNQPSSAYLLYSSAAASALPGRVDLWVWPGGATSKRILLAADVLPDNYAWSPDGTHVLYLTASGFGLIDPDGKNRHEFSPPFGITFYPTWSPDGRQVLLDASSGLWMLNLTTSTLHQLLKRHTGASRWIQLLRPEDLPRQLLTLPSGSPWAPDSQSFLFQDDGALTWQDQPLPTQPRSGDGIYIARLDGTGSLTGRPQLIDWGAHQKVLWTAADPNSSFAI